MAVQVNWSFERAVQNVNGLEDTTSKRTEFEKQTADDPNMTYRPQFPDEGEELDDEKRRRITDAKHEFFNGRQILIGHLPRDTTEKEIRDLLADFELRTVTVETAKHYGESRNSPSLQCDDVTREAECRIRLLRASRCGYLGRHSITVALSSTLTPCID
ncbi:PREDICTED: uncharacterized protein LOC106811200 [Priapulus caudatus]|uniref:Uncharacterized protein LOC106811200 n=1 Tax=Priapulus caudatus TaxID=37621 RepID=A0ABM1EDG8_PRICU|nr:PREDICTED: uncharacterized protein LOC106811200 [Priapulus caudatus]